MYEHDQYLELPITSSEAASFGFLDLLDRMAAAGRASRRVTRVRALGRLQYGRWCARGFAARGGRRT